MSRPEKKLFLLDAMALIYRAHFAFSKTPRITSQGLNTSATFGFVNTVLEVMSKEKPTHLAVAFDTSEPTFRHIEFEAYKAQRQEQPEDISTAIPWCMRVLEAMNIPVLRLPGFEADDIIGTFAAQAAERGFEVFMMTPDKDYAQCVDEHVYLYKPAFAGKGIDVLGVKEVLEKWEISRVDQVTDILGLMGDSVDNIPGIPGVGEKTAKKLIAEWDSVENLVAHAEEIKGKLGENIRAFGAQGLLSKKLATIDKAVPLPFDEEALRLGEYNKEALKQVFEELEFRTMARRVLGEEAAPDTAASPGRVRPSAKPKDTAQLGLFGSPSPAASPEEDEAGATTAPAETRLLRTIENTPHHYAVVQTPAERQELAWFLAQQKEFAFDTETDQLDNLEASLVGLSFAWRAGEAYYVPIPAEAQEAQAVLEDFRAVWENEAIGKIGQNIKYDLTMLRRYGISLKGPLYDTMLAHYLLQPETRHSMDFLSERFLGYSPVSIEQLIGKKGKQQGSMRDVALTEIAEYAAEDADITWQLKQVFAPQITQNQLDKLLLEVEGQLIPVLADMEIEGVRIDPQALSELSRDLADDIQRLEDDIYRAAGEKFNVASPAQLGKILFEKLKLDPKAKKTKTGQYATGEEILSKMANEHELPRLILEIRELQKLKSTYVDALPQLVGSDGRVHTSYNQAVAATGRLSSTNPNLQNIPIRTARGREIRKAFVPRSAEYTILSADYSQIELRIMAEFSGDETMIQAFAENKDIHAITASRLYKVPVEQVDSDMRRKAKTANFGIIYGISAFGLSQRLNIPRREAAEIIDNYFAEFPGIKAWMDKTILQAEEEGYVSTILGRRRYLPNITSRNATDKGFAERNAINTPIQGSAADMIKLAMIAIHDWMKREKLQSRMILQVHDELVFDAFLPEVDILKAEVPRLMKTALDPFISLRVPMDVGLGTGVNWLEAH